MNEPVVPTQSTATLVKATIVALMIASIVFIAVILPVEYDIDPIGVGQLLGLTALSGDSDKSSVVANPNPPSNTLNENEVTVIVPAYKGVEYKFEMQKHAQMTYQWSSDSAPLYFDFHGEPEGDTTGYFESYTIATADKVSGSMTVPFDGVHGWYWKNNSAEDVKVTLTTKGSYTLIGLIH